jgi:hypothetical protein
MWYKHLQTKFDLDMRYKDFIDQGISFQLGSLYLITWKDFLPVNEVILPHHLIDWKDILLGKDVQGPHQSNQKEII